MNLDLKLRTCRLSNVTAVVRAALGGCILLGASHAAPQPTAFQVSQPVTVLSTADMQAAGLLFPDGNLGFVRQAAGRYLVFGAGVSVRDIGPGRQVVPPGTYRFEGDLDRLSPAAGGERYPRPRITVGATQPSPDGGDFDLDYAGGGPTYVLEGSGALLQIYHGEHDCVPGKGMPAWGGIGMALSRDGGASFRKIGQIAAPHVSWREFCGSGRAGGMWSDGSLVTGDAEGRPDPAGAYEYLLFVDYQDVGQTGSAISVARVSKAELQSAVSAGRAPHFMKYFNPQGLAGPMGRFFTEPAVGGRSTPVLSSARFIGTPTVAYDDYLHAYLLVFQTAQKQIEIAESDNLFHWPAPVAVVSIPDADADRLFYPTPVGEGADPLVLGRAFRLYYLERLPANTNPRLLQVTVTAP